MADEENIIEGEVTESSESSSQIILNMESLIKSHISAIDKISEEIKKHKEMLDDIFANDETYQDHLKIVKDAQKIKQDTKSQILKRPQAGDLDKKIKELKSDLKDNQASLSDYLQEYGRLTGTNEIEGEDGQVREIVYVAKLVKRS